MINLEGKAREYTSVPPELRMIGFAGLRAVGLGARTTILKKIRAGTFPWPYLVNGKKLWLVSDIKDYLRTLPKWNPADTEDPQS